MLAEMIKHHVKEDEHPGELFVQARQDDTDFAPIFAGLLRGVGGLVPWPGLPRVTT